MTLRGIHLQVAKWKNDPIRKGREDSVGKTGKGTGKFMKRRDVRGKGM